MKGETWGIFSDALICQDDTTELTWKKKRFIEEDYVKGNQLSNEAMVCLENKDKKFKLAIKSEQNFPMESSLVVITLQIEIAWVWLFEQ